VVGSPVDVGSGVNVGVGVPVGGGGTGWLHPQKKTNAPTKQSMRRNGIFFFMLHERFFRDIKSSLSTHGANLAVFAGVLP
jgi:hypothetical protein